MANSPQALKRSRQSEQRRKHNQGIGTKFRTMLKRARVAVVDSREALLNPDTDLGTVAQAVKNMQSAADIAARKRVIHPRKAARLKKRLHASLRK